MYLEVRYFQTVGNVAGSHVPAISSRATSLHWPPALADRERGLWWSVGGRWSRQKFGNVYISDLFFSTLTVNFLLRENICILFWLQADVTS